eukprot:scaffold108556_cov34-Prasinocladus_malaysianus.AAC.1
MLPTINDYHERSNATYAMPCTKQSVGIITFAMVYACDDVTCTAMMISYDRDGKSCNHPPPRHFPPHCNEQRAIQASLHFAGSYGSHLHLAGRPRGQQ